MFSKSEPILTLGELDGVVLIDALSVHVDQPYHGGMNGVSLIDILYV
jgi:hypothetical protein